MGDARRFHAMADAVESLWPDRELRIADVAAGKGYLRAALYQRGYRNIVCFDKRPRLAGRKHYRYMHFSRQVGLDFDLLLAMHPDEATDVTISEAARRSVPFAVVPCCVKPTAWTFWGRKEYAPWVEHLISKATDLGFDIEQHDLPIQGRSLMLVGVPSAVVTGANATPEQRDTRAIGTPPSTTSQ